MMSKQINSTRPKATRQPRSKWRGDLKECSGNGSCGKFLSVDNFTKKGENKSGSIIYRAQCKLCWNVWRREDAKTEKGREKRRKHQKAYYENNPEKLEAKRLISEAKQKERLKKKCLRIIEKMLKKRLSQVKNNSRIDGIRVKVKSFGYDILSEFNSSHDYALVRCDRGHERRAQLSNIISGCGGCPVCKKDDQIKKLHEASEKQGGKVLGEYINGRTKIDFICRNGTISKRFPKSIINGNDCECCAGNTVELTILGLMESAKNYNLTINSNVKNIKNRQSKVSFTCNKHNKKYEKCIISIIKNECHPCDLCSGRDVFSRKKKEEST